MVRIRPAVKEDSADIARLFLVSSDGLAEYIWSQVAEPGETIAEAGARRYAREGVAFSHENCLMAEVDGKTAGMAHAYPMEKDPDAEPDGDPILAPYGELEDYGSLYLSGIAVFEPYRNVGAGSTLMGAVDRRARDLSLPRVSLICFERNAGAMRLYRRLGFRELDRRPIVPHPCLHYADGDAVLLAREVRL
jgi:ribosomal protein S18 acetylase RimI-like enzyme